ncbi:MAG TPA: serine/threonine-protein kinase [Gaiellaceae bacterium]|nr:serine/threonine-protein kinase [Gaiellaceae bacterium]
MSNAALALEGSGLVLDRYRPLRPLGSGGSGSVWLARDEQTGLEVALKIIAREGKAAVRAEREAAAAARLRHPHCLRAYAFAHDARNVYIAYEFVPGKTVREAMRAGELDDKAAVEACAQVCDALAHAHAHGILHRDVKPSNLLLADGDGVSTRLLDFGLARMAEEETLTAHGDVPGTLAYISPERLAGENASEASDVWAVGVMLWESLAGRHPFWQGSLLDTARAIEAGAPSLYELRADLPKPLIQLVDRALSRDPARRPSAAELGRTLRGAAMPRRAKSRDQVATTSRPGRIPSVVLAVGFAAAATTALPFFPAAWPFGLALAAGAITFLRARLGLAVTLAVPILPLGNVSLGLALLYTAVAAAWLLLCWPQPRAGLLFAVGLLFAPLAALGLVPLATAGVRAAPRRAAIAAAAVLAGAIGAGLRHGSLPFTGVRAPLGLGVAGSTDPLDVAGSLARAAAAHPPLLLAAGILALVAAALPRAREHGYWGAAALGGGMLVLSLLAVPVGVVAPLAVAAAVTAAAIAFAKPSWG